MTDGRGPAQESQTRRLRIGAALIIAKERLADLFLRSTCSRPVLQAAGCSVETS
jgi:hypothetical protein